MAAKYPSEEPKNQVVEEMKIGDLAYSLEVKLISTDRGWFMIEGAASPNMKYNDPAANSDFETVVNTIKSRIPVMSAEDLENLRTSISAGPFRLIKEFREINDKTLYENHQNYEPDVLKKEKEKLEYIMKMQEQIEQLHVEILKKLQEINNPQAIVETTKTKIKKTTDS